MMRILQKTLWLWVSMLLAFNIQAQNALDSAFIHLNNGALLVRLQTKTQAINAIKATNPSLASKIEKQQQRENDSIVKAFSKAFSVCPVYFFYANNSKQIANKLFRNVLLDTTLSPLKADPIFNKPYFIAEFSRTEGDSLQHNATINSYNKQGEVIASRDTVLVYYTGYKLDALVLYDAYFNRLQNPYPHYVRKNIMVRARTYTEMVSLLDEKIRKHQLKLQK